MSHELFWLYVIGSVSGSVSLGTFIAACGMQTRICRIEAKLREHGIWI